MATNTTLEAALTALAGLLFQTKTPSGERTVRTFYIVAGVQRLYRAFDFESALKTDSATTDGNGTLDISELNLDPIPSFDYVGPGDALNPYELVPEGDMYKYVQGDRKYSIVVNEDGDWEMHTSEPRTKLTYTWYDAPTISATTGVIFTPMVIAKAALPYYRSGQDPDADTSVEEDALGVEVRELVEAHERRRPQRFIRTYRDMHGGGIGTT